MAKKVISQPGDVSGWRRFWIVVRFAHVQVAQATNFALRKSGPYAAAAWLNVFASLNSSDRRFATQTSATGRTSTIAP